MGIDNKNLLKAEIKKAINKLLKQNNRNEKDVVRILSSGMITSEFGLCNHEHIKTPAGVDELHNGMKEIVLKEIADIPFVFIRGVKMDAQSFENTDIMRSRRQVLCSLSRRDGFNQLLSQVSSPIWGARKKHLQNASAFFNEICLRQMKYTSCMKYCYTM